jgi:hypothetical protein
MTNPACAVAGARMRSTRCRSPSAVPVCRSPSSSCTARPPDQRLQRVRRDAREGGAQVRQERGARVCRRPWRETPYFSEPERAALALTEALTRVADRAEPPEHRHAAGGRRADLVSPRLSASLVRRRTSPATSCSPVRSGVLERRDAANQRTPQGSHEAQEDRRHDRSFQPTEPCAGMRPVERRAAPSRGSGYLRRAGADTRSGRHAVVCVGTELARASRREQASAHQHIRLLPARPDFPRRIIEFQRRFLDEDACRDLAQLFVEHRSASARSASLTWTICCCAGVRSRSTRSSARAWARGQAPRHG